MIRKFIVEIDDSLRGAENDIFRLERAYGAEEIKTGHWIDDIKYGGTEYSECGKWYPHATIAKSEIKYCSECGARMVEPQERSGEECGK